MSAFRVLAALSLLVGLAGPVQAGGTRGVGPDGKQGWLHRVETGDTLWDITATYLGTPWIWPAIWKENGIANPHRIYPGDLVWITEGGIRKVTPAEAEALVQPREAPAQVPPPVPAAPAPTPSAPPDPFASLDGSSADVERVLRWPGLHRYGFLAPDQVAGSGAVLGSHDESYWASQERRTIVSIGEDRARIGDVYTVFRIRRRVLHPETHALFGYFVDILGTAEVEEIHPEASFVKIVTSYSEIEPGDRLVEFEAQPEEFKAAATTSEVSGLIVAMQPHRQVSGAGDVVVLDRGADDGLVAGNELEIFRAGKEVSDPSTMARVLVPDDVLGRMFVLKASAGSSLALVRRARTELRVGDHFRTD